MELTAATGIGLIDHSDDAAEGGISSLASSSSLSRYPAMLYGKHANEEKKNIPSSSSTISRLS
jgi:hypothetical protein